MVRVMNKVERTAHGFYDVQSERRGAAANRLQDHRPARGGRRGMVGTWSKSQTGKGPAHGVTQRRRGVAWLQAVSTCSASPPRSASWAFPASAIDPVKCSRTGLPVPLDSGVRSQNGSVRSRPWIPLSSKRRRRGASWGRCSSTRKVGFSTCRLWRRPAVRGVSTRLHAVR